MRLVYVKVGHLSIEPSPWTCTSKCFLHALRSYDHRLSFRITGLQTPMGDDAEAWHPCGSDVNAFHMWGCVASSGRVSGVRGLLLNSVHSSSTPTSKCFLKEQRQFCVVSGLLRFIDPCLSKGYQVLSFLCVDHF